MIRKDFRPNVNVRFVSSRDLDYNYIGMNREAALELKNSGYYHGRIPADSEIYVDKSLNLDDKRRVIRHECVERRLMKRGLKYKKAHAIANKYEK